MPAFDFKAIDAAGQVSRGVIEGESERHARQLLRQRRLRPVAVRSATGAGPSSRAWQAPWHRLGAGEVAILTRQLATLVEASVPLADALASVGRQQRSRSAAAVLIGLRSEVLSGHSLAYALGNHPDVFDPMYRAMVRAGEQSGHLGPVLSRLAEHSENRLATRQRLRAAAVYPLVLMGVALLVVIALMHFVVPELVRIFAGASTDLPLLTRGLIGLSSVLEAHGTLLLATLLAVLLGLQRLLRLPGFKRVLHAGSLRLPLLGDLLRGIEAERYAGSLGILVGAGVPLLTGLGMAAEVLQDGPMRKAAEQARLEVEQGERLHRALGQHDAFPAMMVQLVASGEQGGELEAMLVRASRLQQRDNDMRISALLALLEPLLVVIMGGFVLLIVLAVLMPVFELNTLVK